MFDARVEAIGVCSSVVDNTVPTLEMYVGESRVFACTIFTGAPPASVRPAETGSLPNQNHMVVSMTTNATMLTAIRRFLIMGSTKGNQGNKTPGLESERHTVAFMDTLRSCIA